MAKILMNFCDWTHTKARREKNTYGGIGYYRIIKPSEQIKGHEVKVVGKEIEYFGNTLEEQWDNIFKEYDVYWCNYFSDERAAAAIFYHAQKYGKKVIIDIDDNYLDIPESNLLYDKFKKTKKDRAMLSTILSFADAITTSTEPLAKRIGEHIKKVHGLDKKIYVVPNMNDISDWKYEPVAKAYDRIVIGYSGSNSHMDDLLMVLPSIKEIMIKNKNVWFEMIGILSKDKIGIFSDFPSNVLDRIGLIGATETFGEYPEWLSKQKWNIGIAPLVDTDFTRSKSHIKWMEYSMYKIPTVASRVYPYYMDIGNRQTIIDGDTGILCKENEWVNKLQKLIDSPELRTKIGNNAYEAVKKEWQYDLTQVLDKMFKELGLEPSNKI